MKTCFSIASSLILLQLLTSALASDKCYQCLNTLEKCKKGSPDKVIKVDCSTGTELEKLISNFNTKGDKRLEEYSTELATKANPNADENEPTYTCLKFTYQSLLFNETIAISSCLPYKAKGLVCGLAEGLLASRDCQTCDGDLCNSNSALSVLSNQGLLCFTVFLAIIKSFI